MSGVLNGPTGREPLGGKVGNRERPPFLDPCGALTVTAGTALVGLRFTKFANLTEVKPTPLVKGPPRSPNEASLARNPIMPCV